MDTVRFGRALGMGARGAAKAVLAAADAAAAPKPAATRPQAAPSQTTRVTQTVAQVRETQANLIRGGRRFNQTAWRPFMRVGGVLWLELTGVFFGIFALFAASNAWKLRGSLHPSATNQVEHQHLLWSFAMAALFGYFCVSSFLRARRRSRGR